MASAQIDILPDIPDDLSQRKQAALQALLTCPTLKEAAQAAGVSEVTLWRYMNSPGFKTLYEKLRREMVQRSLNQLQHASARAVEVMIEIMSDKAASPSARLAAAKTVMDYAVQSAHIDDLADTLRALEFYFKYEREAKKND